MPNGVKPESLVKDATCQMVGGGPGVPSNVYTCRCKCYHDWRLDSWDEYWNDGGCSHNGSWHHYDWRDDSIGSGTGCCNYNSQEMGRISCLSECEAYCGNDSPNVIKSGIDKFPEPFRSSLLDKVNRTMNRKSESGSRGVSHKPSGWSYRQMSGQAFLMFEMISPLGAQSQIAQGNPNSEEIYGWPGVGASINYLNDEAESQLYNWDWVAQFHHSNSAIGVFYNDVCVGLAEYGYVPNSDYLNYQVLPIMLYDSYDNYGVPEGTMIWELDFKYYDGATTEIWDLVLSPVGTPYVDYNGNYAYPPYEEIGGLFPGVYNYPNGYPYEWSTAWAPCNSTIWEANSSCVDPYAWPPINTGGTPPPDYCSGVGEGTPSLLADGFQNLDIIVVEGLSITGQDIQTENFCVNGNIPYIGCNWSPPMENPNPEPSLVSFPILKDGNNVEDLFGTEGPIYKLIGEGEAAQLTDGVWYGSANVIDPFMGYWVYNYDSGPGYSFPPIDRALCISNIYDELIYDLHFGANLISYPYGEPLSLEEGMFGYEDQIHSVIGDGEAAMYTNHPDNGPGWYGSLTAFEPGKAYWVITNTSLEFEWIPTTVIRRRNSSGGKYKPLIKQMIDSQHSTPFNYIEELFKQKKLRRTASQRFFYHPLKINWFNSDGDMVSVDTILSDIEHQLFENHSPSHIERMESNINCNNLSTLHKTSIKCPFPTDSDMHKHLMYYQCLSKCEVH